MKVAGWRFIIGTLVVLGAAAVAGAVDAAKVTVKIAEQSASHTVFEVCVPGVDIEEVVVEDMTFDLVKLAGGVTAWLDIGRPQVPRVPVLLGIPAGATATVEVETLVVETRMLEHDAYPLQPDGDSLPFQFDEAFYQLDTVYPGLDIQCAHTATWRDLDVADFFIYPVQVNPGEGWIAVATYMRVRVDYAGGSGYPTSVARWIMPQYARMVDNFAQLGLSARQEDADDLDYLIACHPAYAASSWLQDSLLGWLRRKGYRCAVEVGRFQESELKALVTSYYQLHGIRWLLIVADVDSIGYSGAGDFCYSDLTGDGYPEVGVARLTAPDSIKVNYQIDKLLRYQLTPPQDSWLDRMVLVGNKDEHEGYMDCVRAVCSMPLGYHSFLRDTIMGTSAGNDDVTAALWDTSGAGVLVYRGHGGNDNWDNWTNTGNPCWWNENVPLVRNGHKTPVVFNISCLNGQLNSSDFCLSEAWVHQHQWDSIHLWRRGAVASLGATRTTNTTANHGFCSTLVRAFSDSIAVAGHPEHSGPVFDLGSILMLGDAYGAKYYPGKSDHDAFLMLGEPSMPVWSGGVPETAVVVCPDTIPENATAIAVSVHLAGGRAVEDALVCVWNQAELGFHVAGRTDATGLATLSLGPHSAGPVLLTVSEGHAEHSNHSPGVLHTPILPYLDTIWTEGVHGTWWEWDARSAVPEDPSGKYVRRGGWLASDGDGHIYAAKGHRTRDFYCYDVAGDSWVDRAEIPDGTEAKRPKRGCKGVWGDGAVFMTKGNNSLGFWHYDPSLNQWDALPDVPLGPHSKRVKTGIDAVYVSKDDTGYVYLLKGRYCEFYRYNTRTRVWDTMPDAPQGVKGYWRDGSWLVYDGASSIFAHKAKYYDRDSLRHEMWKFCVEGDTWYSVALPGMPLFGLHGGWMRKKKSLDGSAGAWHTAEGGIVALKGGNTQQFFKYDVAANCWSELETIPSCTTAAPRLKRVKYGGDLVVLDGTFFALKGGNSPEFWRCRYLQADRPEGPPVLRRSVGKHRAPLHRSYHAGSAVAAPFTTPGLTRLVMRPVMQEAGSDVALPGLVDAGGKPAREGRDGGVVCVV
ncbi:MAG: hypothetical protein JXA67_19875, partial [Micromonosporaceae bacterium]|nr:hypothetical protein [Micromonosporaceae bacterium]